MKKTTLFRLAFAAANPAEFSRCHGAAPLPWRFRDGRSEANYHAALAGKPLPMGVPQPITVIQGPPGTGKTELARHLAELLGDPEPMFGHAHTAAKLERDLDIAVRYERKCLIFDNIYQFHALSAPCLALIARPQGFNRHREGMAWKAKTYTQLPRVILTCPDGTVFPADLARRMRVIELAAPAESAAA